VRTFFPDTRELTMTEDMMEFGLLGVSVTC
jgi:hypothetical protein